MRRRVLLLFSPALAGALMALSAPAGAALVSPFGSEWALGTHLSTPHTIYAYTWPQSVQAGDTLSIYVSSVSPTVGIRFLRVGLTESYVFDATGAHHTGVPAGPQLVPEGGTASSGVWSDGCGWSPTMRIVVPQNWASGPYYVEVWPENGEPVISRQYATFVVRPSSLRSNLAVVVCSSTWYAYQAWGGKSLYDSPSWDRAFKVSARRPNERNDGRGNFATRDLPWVRFLAYSNLTADYMTMEDIQRQGRSALDPYEEVIFEGHSEYWSEEQRAAVEDYVAHGGNVFFACGNICWWRIEYSPDLSQVICYRGDNVTDASGGTRGIAPGTQYLSTDLGAYPPHPATYMWRLPPANRGAYSMTGLDFFDAEVGSSNIDGLGTPGDWTVRFPQHWVFNGTGLPLGAKLNSRFLPGDEVDGLPLSWQGNPLSGASTPVILQSAYNQGTPASFEILATAEAAPFSHTFAQVPRWAVLGTYQRPGEGKVVTWGEQLLGFDVWDVSAGGVNCYWIAKIADNIIRGLMSPAVPTGVNPDAAAGPGLHASIRPNPCGAGAEDRATIRFSLARPSRYAFDVFSAAGQSIGRDEGTLDSGLREVSWRFPEASPAGIYFWKLSTASGTASGKLVHVR